MKLGRRRFLAPRAWLALGLLAFAQIAFAASACLGTRTERGDDGCAVAELLCWTHCQAEDQTTDAGAIPIPAADALAPVARGPVAPVVMSAQAPARHVPPIAAPPPILRFGRLLI